MEITYTNASGKIYHSKQAAYLGSVLWWRKQLAAQTDVTKN